MKKRLNGILTLFLVLVVQMTFAQTKTVTGTVIDENGMPLPGVNVIVKNSNTGAQTDFDGKYKISVDESATLVFSYVGYVKQEIPVSGTTVINVTMNVDASALAEVVIQGYRTSTKAKSSIASTTITAETIENRPNASFVQTLSGQVAGLNITTNSGQPGANSTVNLRGITSINGNTEPLFIIDGAPVDSDNFRSLNPQNIASISVLKDAGATAIYGNRGANGVVIIETKQGSYNSSLKIDATSILSFDKLPSNDYGLLNSQQQLMLERTYGNGLGTTLTDQEINQYKTTNWLDYFFRTGVTKNNTVNLSSGSENSTQFTSLGFLENEGILKDSDLKRFSIRNNITGKSDNDKFTYGSNFSINYSTSNIPNSIGSGAVNRNYILGANQSVPYRSPDDYTSGAELVQNFGFVDTPLLLMDRLKTYSLEEEEVKLIGSFNAAYKITDDWEARVVMSSDYSNIITTRAEGPTSFNALLFAQTGNTTPGFQNQQSRRVFTYNQVTSLNYEHVWGDNTLSAGAYVEYFKAHLRTFGFGEEGLDPKTFYPGDGSGFIDDNSDNDFFSNSVNADIKNAGLFSYFAQADYDFNSTYGLAATIRRDASYRFAASNRYGTFYSISGRWNISKEAFMDGSIFNDLKLRGSYGTAGNQRISGTTYFSAPDLTQNFYATGSGYGGKNSIFLSQIANTTLKWETVTQSDVGIDFEMFHSRVGGSVDGYIKKTTDLFQSTPVSAINGITSLNANTGTLKNTGVDLTLHYDLLRGGNDGLNLKLNFVGNYNKTELGEIPSQTGEIDGLGRNGGKLYEYKTIRYAGVNPADGNLLFYTADGQITESPNADTDRVYINKNIYPDYTGSFGLNADYKGFFLTASFNYIIGVDRYDFDLSGYQDPTSIGQFRSNEDLLRAWTPDNRITDIPRLHATNINTYASTRYLTDASYLRLRFASIGYSVPTSFLEKSGFTSVKVFANAENLLTFSKWRGFDPEAQSNGSRLYPTPKIISVGVELGL